MARDTQLYSQANCFGKVIHSGQLGHIMSYIVRCNFNAAQCPNAISSNHWVHGPCPCKVDMCLALLEGVACIVCTSVIRAKEEELFNSRLFQNGHLSNS